MSNTNNTKNTKNNSTITINYTGRINPDYESSDAELWATGEPKVVAKPETPKLPTLAERLKAAQQKKG